MSFYRFHVYLSFFGDGTDCACYYNVKIRITGPIDTLKNKVNFGRGSVFLIFRRFEPHVPNFVPNCSREYMVKLDVLKFYN